MLSTMLFEGRSNSPAGSMLVTVSVVPTTTWGASPPLGSPSPSSPPQAANASAATAEAASPAAKRGPRIRPHLIVISGRGYGATLAVGWFRAELAGMTWYRFVSCQSPWGVARQRDTVHRSDGSAAGERAPEGDLVGVLEVAPDRQAAGQAGDGQSQLPDHQRQVGRGRLALGVRVGGEDELGDGAAGQAGHQLADPQLVRSDALQRVDGAPEDVVAPPELAGALDRHDVLGLLHHTDDLVGAARIPAYPAGLRLGDVEADGAEPHLLLDPAHRARQPVDVGRVRGQQVEGDPLGALRPDAGKAAKLVDQVLDRTFVHAPPSAATRQHLWPCRPGLTGATSTQPPPGNPGIPGRPPRPGSPPASGPSLRSASLRCSSAAACRAATMRSSRVSTSSRSTASGSIRTARTSPEPDMVTVTRPPPDEPVTSSSASSAEAVTSCCCTASACCMSCCRSGCPPGPTATSSSAGRPLYYGRRPDPTTDAGGG